MARTNLAYAVVRKDNSCKFVSSPTDDFHKTQEAFKSFLLKNYHDEFSSVTYQESDGPSRTINFPTKDEFEAVEKRKAADHAAFTDNNKPKSKTK